MNKLTTALFTTLLTISAFSVNAATTPDNKDDASNLGNADSPQVKQQQIRTDKGPSGVNQGAAQDMNSRNADKNKVFKTKEENHGTTKGNQIQPASPESAAPALN